MYNVFVLTEKTSSNKIGRWIILLLLILILVLNIGSARFKSPTYDERIHFKYGNNLLNLNSDRTQDSVMPFSAFNAIPPKISVFLPGGTLKLFLSEDFARRVPTMLFAVLLGFFTFKWANELYGRLPGLLALFLFTFEPNILAHSHWVTTDLYGTCMITISVYYFWRFNNERTWKNALISATVLGISQHAKFTSAYLYPLFFVMYLLFDSQKIKDWITRKDLKQVRQYLGQGFSYLIVFALISILILNTGYLFNGFLTPLGDYAFRSELFKGLQSKLSFMAQFPLPLPVPFLEGLDQVKYNDIHMENQGYVYFMGELKPDGVGAPGYFFLAMLLKVPIAIQILIIWASAQYIFKDEKQGFLKNEMFLFVPILFFLIYFNFFFHVHLGIRFILVIFPMLLIFASRLARNWETVTLKRTATIVVLGIYLVASNLSYFPQYIPYFNEFVWRRELAYKYLADSNIDWGQNEYYLKQYLEENRDVLYRQRRPKAGTIVVSVNELVGIWGQIKKFAWLRENFEPVDSIGYSYLIYKVTEEDVQNLDPSYFPCPTCPSP